MELILTKSKWIRGEHLSFLYRPSDGKQCCIGQMLSQIGFSAREMSGTTTVNRLTNTQRGAYDRINQKLHFLLSNSDMCPYNLYQINDNPDTSDEQKIDGIKRILERYGHTLKVEE